MTRPVVPGPARPSPGESTRADKTFTPLGTAPVPSAPVRRGSAGVVGIADALVLGLAAVLVSGAFAWRPSAWYDEAATAVAVRQSWSGLAGILSEVDLVHGLHYVLLRPWVELVGASPFALRVPSALAVGLGTALLVLLVRRLGGRRLAVTAGIVFLLLPRVTWAGTEARSYALVTAVAVGWTLAFVVAAGIGRFRTAPGRWSWVVYAALGALSTVLFLYTALLLLAHAATLVLLRRRPGRAAVLAAGSVAVLALGFGAAVARQSAQVYWLPRIDASIGRMVVADQFFLGAKLPGVIGWAVVGVVAVGVLLAARRAAATTGSPRRSALLGAGAVALPWLVLPLAVLVAVSVVEPRYYPRYLSFTAPAFAVLLALALQRLPLRAAVPAGAGFALLLGPGYVAQREVVSKEDADWALVAEQMRGAARPGDAVLFGPLDTFPGDTRAIAESYPDAFAGLLDPTRAESRTGLWNDDRPLAAAALAGVERVWVVRAEGEPLTAGDADARILVGSGFTEVDSWVGPATTVREFTRSPG